MELVNSGKIKFKVFSDMEILIWTIHFCQADSQNETDSRI
jgi:hypothetical protein